MEEKRTLVWDGEQIKQITKIADEKVTPKIMLESINRLKNAIAQGNEQKANFENGIKNTTKELARLKGVLAERLPFEEKCIKLQKEKLLFLIKANKKEIMAAAIEEVEKTKTTIKPPMTDDQIKNRKYLNYQTGIGRHPKVANKIAAHLIAKFIYANPIFDNPFV